MRSDFNDIRRMCRAKGIAFAMVDIPAIGKMYSRHGSESYRHLLTEWECAYADSRKIPKRRIDFLSGRIAGKRAVSEYLNITGQAGGESPGFNDIEIRKTDSGAPAVCIMNEKSDLLISISHSGRYAVSMVSDLMHYRGIGIDVEMIEERDNSFLSVAFSDAEIARLRREQKNPSGDSGKGMDDEITRHWTIKESMLKSLGIGLNVDLRDIDIKDGEGSGTHFEMRNDVQKKYELIGARGIGVDSFRVDRYIISISYLHQGAACVPDGLQKAVSHCFSRGNYTVNQRS